MTQLDGLTEGLAILSSSSDGVLPSFNLEAILNSLVHELSNARVESLNTCLRLLTRRAFGFHSAQPLIGMAMLSFGGLQLTLPGRAA